MQYIGQTLVETQSKREKLEDRTEVLIHYLVKTKEKYRRVFKKGEKLIERFQYFSNISCKRERIEEILINM